MEIRIVEYEKKYAAQVAEMWNHSRDGWGGANTIDTEETILHREASSTNILTYLAVEGDKVVGYCGLSEYREDEGALYIPLLNVRDDYHGKKIGKKLLLNAIKKTMELQWPRLDLYTWPGNTKAVPLYKKCGFFWEERDDSTHLMNFIPSVMRTEAVQDFFKEADWYENSIRKIEIKPDGRVENGFHYYEYTWEKEDSMLRIEFERTGRGVRLIETDEYYISATVPQHQLVFGNEYEITFNIRNKTSKPLHIDLAGKKDKIIEFQFNKSLIVEDETEVTGSFYLGSIDEEQNDERTHPCVQTSVNINGKQADFKVGILPKLPAQISADLIEDLTFKNKTYVFYLNLKNNFSEKVQYEIDFPSSQLLDMEQHLLVEMEAKERKSIALPITVNDYGYYQAGLQIKAIKENGTEITFSKRIGLPMRGIGSAFFGEDDEHLQVFNGQYFVSLNKQDNTVWLGRKKKESRVGILTPKVGKPYSEELARTRFVKVHYFDEKRFNGLKITYKLTAFPKIRLHIFLKLFPEGLVENYYEVENIGDAETEESIWMNQSIYLDLEQAVLPYRNGIVTMNDSIGNTYEQWDDQKLSENWLFIKGATDPIGITWDPTENIHFESWHHYFEHHLGMLKAKSSLQSLPVTFSIGAFHDMESFRAFAAQSVTKEKVKPVNHLRLSLEHTNPFLKGEKFKALVTDYKSNYLHGELRFAQSPDEKSVINQLVHRKDKKTDYSVEMNLDKAPLVTTVKLEATLDAAVQVRETLLIRQNDDRIKESIINDHEFNVWQVDNGLLQLKAAPEFYPAIYSMKAKGQEWLDTSFPKLQPKLWWNPWSGGLSSRLSKTRTHSVSKEETSASFAGLTDNKGNEWRGIKLSTTIIKNEDFEGLIYHQYFLLLPGAPILCHVSEIEQGTGRFFNGEEWQTTGFFKASESMESNWVNMQDQAGDWTKVVAGKDENDLEIARNMIIGCNEREEHLQFISHTEKTKRMGYVNKEVMLVGAWERLTLPAGTSQFTTPNFYLFNNQVIHDKAQHDLQDIYFRCLSPLTLST